MKGKFSPIIIILAMVLAIMTIIVFSPGLAIAKIIGEAALLVKILIYAIYVVLAAAILMVINQLIKQKPKEMKLEDLDTKEEFVEVLSKYVSAQGFLSIEADKLRTQAVIFDSKIETFLELINQKFEGAVASYSKFKAIAKNIKKVVFENLRSGTSIVSTFNDLDYQRFLREKDHYAGDLAAQKKETFEGYKSEINAILLQNEAIFVKLDKLQLELSKTVNSENTETNSLIDDLNNLITQTKLYQ